MLQITLEEAYARLGELIDVAKRGEAVVIVKGREAVQLVPVAAPAQAPRQRCLAGSAAGQIHFASDFDALLDDFAEYMT